MKHWLSKLLLIAGLWIAMVSVSSVKADEAAVITKDTITLSETTYTYDAEEHYPDVTVKDTDGNILTEGTDYELVYKKNLKAGTAYVYVKGKGQYKTPSPIEKTFTIKPVAMTAATISSVPDQAYTGKLLKPYPKVSFKGTTLVKGTDYLLTYENNKDIGTATITVTGKYNFTGTATLTFNITGLSLDNATVAPLEPRVYRAAPIEPSVTVTLNGKTVGKSGYTLSYENNENVGTATITITGKGNYSGSTTTTFEIIPKECTPLLTIHDKLYTYDGTQKTPTVTVGTYLKEKLDPSEYTVTMEDGRINAGTYKVTVKLKGNYSGTKVGTFRIARKRIVGADVKITPYTFTYDGLKHKPTLEVTLDGVTLKKGKDYKLKFSNNKNVGSAVVQIVGKGNYQWKIKKYFVIRPAKQDVEISVKAKTFKVKYSNLKKSELVLSASNVFMISGGIGTFEFDSASGNRSFFTVDNSTGDIHIEKETPKGTYTVTVKIGISGDENHLKTYRLIPVKIKVK